MDALTIDENSILEKVKAAAEVGDQETWDEAVGQLYVLYRVRVLRWARVATRSQQDAEDVASLVWKRFWKEFKHDKSSPKGFLWQLVQWVATDFYRPRDASLGKEPLREAERDQEGSEYNFVDTRDTAENLLRQIRLCELVLEVAFKNNPAHQRLSFGFRDMLEWTPMEIVTKLSGEYLNALCHKLRLDYLAVSSIELARLNRLLAPLCEDLKARNEKVMIHYKTRETWAPLLHRIAKDTKLEEYYIPYPGSLDTRSANITEWAETVRRKVIMELRKLGIASR